MLYCSSTSPSGYWDWAEGLPAAASRRRALLDPPLHYPALAKDGIPAALLYAKRPAAPYAQHMPSHIFTRVGYWKESIESNTVSAEAAANEKEPTDELRGQFQAASSCSHSRQRTICWSCCALTRSISAIFWCSNQQ